uniref:Uncharacterized protein n=1 Tax=Meloidogyne hapla TaxID=6305 RepID=A0A1I8B8Y9_MELHA
MDIRLDDPILKSRHSLDMGIQSMDSRLKQILELNIENDCLLPSTSTFDNNSEDLRSHSFYSFIYPSDVKYFSDAHEMASSSSLNENYGDLIINLVEENNFVINQNQQFINNSQTKEDSTKLTEMLPTTTTINNNNIYYNNLNNEDVSSMISTFPYYYYYYCISPNQQQNLFGSLIMDLTNNEGVEYINNNNCIIPG